MKESAVQVLDERELTVVELLEGVGFSRQDAFLITYLYRAGEATSRDIEISGNLRQPEVSKSLQGLRENGWINEKNAKRTGKGRPYRLYSLSCSLDKLLADYELSISKESEMRRESIQRIIALTVA